MQKIKPIVVIIILLMCLSSCNAKKITYEQSLKNKEYYIERLAKVAENYGYTLEYYQSEGTSDGKTYNFDHYTIKITDDSSIDVDVYWNNKIETFSITYLNQLKDENEQNRYINKHLFVDLVNEVSGKEITLEYINDFLYSSEDKYPSIKAGYEKDEKYTIINKKDSFGFFPDWQTSYLLRKDLSEEFRFSGLTKQLNA